MRYFTPAWHAGDLSEDETELIPVQYAKHLETLQGRLPAAMRALITSVSFHDAQISGCTLDHIQRSLLLHLVTGDNQSGYTSVDLTYHGIALGRIDFPSFCTAAGNAESELLYDEIDLEGEYFIHRLLFWPYREFEIYFRTVEVRTAPASGRLEAVRAVPCLEIGAHAI